MASFLKGDGDGYFSGLLSEFYGTLVGLNFHGPQGVIKSTVPENKSWISIKHCSLVVGLCLYLLFNT